MVLRELDTELERLRALLRRLESSKKRGFALVVKLGARSPMVPIQNFRGLIVSHTTVTQIQNASLGRSTLSHSKFTIPNTLTTVNHTSLFTQVRSTVAAHDRLLELMFGAVRQWRHFVREKALRLAVEYADRRALWTDFCAALDEYAAQAREGVQEWPPEFAMAAVRPPLEMADGEAPMFLDAMEAASLRFWDFNNFVADPEREHVAFKGRLCWADAEVRVFVEKYSQWPKDFKRIAGALPNKSVKDVIEFYFIRRIELNLKDIEVAARKRGRKKMLVSRSAAGK
jgi:hypothetical protein